MKIALIHDYLFEYGGAERVLEALHEIWPEAPIYTSFVDWDWVAKNKREWMSWKIRSSWYDKMPFKKTLCSPLRFLASRIWESFDLRGFDLVISSSAWFMCKGVITHPGTTHICYCHTPPRYLYGYPESSGKKNWLARFYAFWVNPFMRRYDYLTSQKVNDFVCNSREVQGRIKKFYRRDSEVIYPPIEISNSKLQIQDSRFKKEYYLMVNRLVWPKRVDLAIKACKKLGLNLKIVGQGKAEKGLKELAGNDPKIEFLGYVDDQKLAQLYQQCKAVLYLAQEEDFGITPLEAAGWGKPVIALRSGGVVESVIEGKTGFFVDKPEVSEVVKVLKRFNDLNHFSGINLSRPKGRDIFFPRKNSLLLGIRPEACFNQAKKFSKDRFKREIENFVKKMINQK